jgi:outer membrane immunogenic protein
MKKSAAFVLLACVLALVGAAAVEAADWHGAYIGFGFGAASGNAKVTSDVASGLPPGQAAVVSGAGNQALAPNGLVVSGHIGYNRVFGDNLIGIEGELGNLDLSESASTEFLRNPGGTDFRMQSSIATSALLTLRPRYGRISGNWLYYAAAGIAATSLEASFRYEESPNVPGTARTSSADVSKLRMGWTIGAGIEYDMRESTHFRLEYLYVDFGKVTASTNMTNTPSNPTFAHTMELKTHILRFALIHGF